MRVVFLTPGFEIGGGIRMIASHAHHLAAAGHEVTVIAQPRYADFRWTAPWRWRNARTKSDLARSDGRSYYPVDTRVRHVTLDRSGPVTTHDVPDADAVVATWWETAEWVAALPASKGRKFHYVQGHEVFPYLPVERVKATYRLPLRKIVVARWLADLMAKDYGDPTAVVVSNAVDRAQFDAPPRGKAARPSLGFVWSDAPGKGCDVVIEAMRALRRERADLRLVAFGMHAAPRAFHELRVEYHRSPAQSDLASLYSSCDAWMTASRSEGFYLPAMEAMACRTPMIATATGWPAEAIRDGENGRLIPFDDPKALCDAARWVIDRSATQWRAVSDAAHATVSGSSWNDVSRRFAQALQSACTPTHA